ncbi:MAG: tetratricopeptide repeat protein [Pseudomonadota bacterium]
MPELKNTVFTFITIVVVPILFFVLLELGLMAFGVGQSFDYFHEIDINGEPHYQENPNFADQFYPESLNIGPLENTFAKARDPELVRVYVLGGSAAQGFPHKNHGFDRLLGAQLRAAMPSRKIEVINTAMTSVNSHVVYEVARSIPDDSADFAIILMGNNEVVGPYGPGTFNQNFLSNLTLIRTTQALKRTRLWQGLSGILQSVNSTDAMQELEWEGMQMFTNHGVPHDDPRMGSVYDHYEDNLIDIVETLQDKGIHVLLSSVPVNLRHSAPFLSVHDTNLTEAKLDEWNEKVRAGSQSADEGNWQDAVLQFLSALEIDPDYADTHFRLATALENLGRYDEAQRHYIRSMELDALRFRADTRINQIVHGVATAFAGENFSFVDSAAAFEKTSEPYQPGWNLLLEHVHYDFAGNHVLAAEFSRSIAGDVNGDDSFQPLPGADVAARIGFPNYDTIEEIKNLQGMIEHPPFPGQANYAELQEFLAGKVDRISRAVGSQSEVVQRRQRVVDAGVADWKVHFELAVINQRLRNPPAMYFHLNKILELYPHNRETYMKLADAMSREGKWREVIPHLEQSLHYTRGDQTKIAETVNWIGTAYLRVGDYETGKRHLLEIPDNYPDQIDLSLRAYGNLISYSRQNGKDKDLHRYIERVNNYARSIQSQAEEAGYPLNQRMTQIMNMGGQADMAKEWAEAPAQ